MKIRIKKEDRQWMTLNEAEAARRIAEDLKEEDAADLIMRAARVWTELNYSSTKGKVRDLTEEVLKTEAKFARNERLSASLMYFDESAKSLDVWIEGLVATQWGFLEIHSYLSDIWAIGDEDSRRCLVNHSYARPFFPPAR